MDRAINQWHFEHNDVEELLCMDIVDSVPPGVDYEPSLVRPELNVNIICIFVNLQFRLAFLAQDRDTSRIRHVDVLDFSSSEDVRCAMSEFFSLHAAVPGVEDLPELAKFEMMGAFEVPFSWNRREYPPRSSLSLMSWHRGFDAQPSFDEDLVDLVFEQPSLDEDHEDLVIH